MKQEFVKLPSGEIVLHRTLSGLGQEAKPVKKVPSAEPKWWFVAVVVGLFAYFIAKK